MPLFTPSPVRTARKSAEQRFVNNTQTVITELDLVLAANATIQFEAVLYYDSTLANDLYVSVVVPAGAAIEYGAVAPWITATNYTGPINGRSRNTSGNVLEFGGGRAAGAAAERLMVTIRGIAVNGATAGSIQFRASKFANTDTTTPADDLTIFANSHVRGVVG